MTGTFAHGYSSKSTQCELSNKYQHDRVKMVLKNICVLVLWTKVALAMVGWNLMPLVANLANAKWCKKTWSWLKPWHMGTHLRVLSQSYPMNTNTTGLRWLSKIFDSLFFGWALALDGLNQDRRNGWQTHWGYIKEGRAWENSVTNAPYQGFILSEESTWSDA